MSNKTLSKPRWDNLLTELAARDVQVEVKEVRAYLDAFPDIADVVTAICRRTREEFGPKAFLMLSMDRKLEIDDTFDNASLVLRVGLTEFTTEAVVRMARIEAGFDKDLCDKMGLIRVTAWRRIRRDGDSVVMEVLPESQWQDMLAALAALGVHVEEKEVRAYLDNFPDIADVVVPFCRTTREEFGPGAVLNLVINRDPEIDDKYLKLRVGLHAFPPEILEKFHRISDAHEEQTWDKKGYILVTTGPLLNG